LKDGRIEIYKETKERAVDIKKTEEKKVRREDNLYFLPYFLGI
jgi:hypothetical protein